MKWQYLRVVIWNRPSDSHIAPNKVEVIGEDGERIEWKKEKGDASHLPVVSRLLAKLGEDGWELVGIAEPDGLLHTVLYFKRPQSLESKS